MAYVSVAELRSLVGLRDEADDAALTLHVEAASEAIESFCGRSFAVPTVAALRRVKAADPFRLMLPPGHDIASTTGLVVATDDNDDGTAETSWTITTDFELFPWAQVDAAGRASAPWTEIRSTGARLFPTCGRRPQVHVTARWGWPAVPWAVREAAAVLAHRRYVMSRNAPAGTVAMGDFGPMVLRDRPDLLQRLQDLTRKAKVGAYGR